MTTAWSPSRSRAWIALVGLALPLFALSVDAYGVGVLLPEIASDLHIDPLRSGAVVSVAAIGTAAPLLFVGRLGDRWGPRRLLLIGVVGFALSSLTCAVAGSFGVLLAGRVLQGFSSACCFTTSLAVIDAMFDDARRPVAVGIWAAIGGVGGALGPLVGSLVATAWSWRGFFAVNVGLGIVALAVLGAVVPRIDGRADRSLQPERLLVLALGLAAALGGLQRVVGSGWGPGTLVPLVVGTGLIALAVAPRERGALVASSVTSPWSFRAGTWVATVTNWGSGVMFALVPPALTAIRGLSVLETGFVLLAFSAPFALGSAISGPLVERTGGFVTSGASAALEAIGLAALGLVGLDAPLGLLLGGLAVAGLGNGIAYSAATSLALADVPRADAGEASGVLTMLRLVGLSIGVALSSLVVDAFAGHHFRETDGIDAALVVAAAVSALGVLAVRRAPAGRH